MPTPRESALTAVTALADALDAATDAANGGNARANDLLAQLDAANTTIASLRTSVATATANLSAANSSIRTFEAQIAADAATIADLAAKLAAAQSSQPSVTDESLAAAINAAADRGDLGQVISVAKGLRDAAVRAATNTSDADLSRFGVTREWVTSVGAGIHDGLASVPLPG